MNIQRVSSILLGAIPATLMLFSTAALADRFQSKPRLTGAQEVPTVTTDGTARATVEFDKGFTKVRVRLRFKNLNGNFTRLHFHCNVAGTNGPIAIGLIDMVNPDFDNSDVVSLDGNRIVGTLTNEDFPDTESCADVIGKPVNNIASLAAAIDRGEIYINLHTDAFPPGEVRGQVRPLKHDRHGHGRHHHGDRD